MTVLCDKRTILALLGQASRTLYPHLDVRPGTRRGQVVLRRYTNDGLAGEAEVLVADLVALERAGRAKLHRGPVHRPQPRGGASTLAAFRQIVLAWSPRWFPSEDSLRSAEINGVPWPTDTTAPVRRAPDLQIETLEDLASTFLDHVEGVI